MSDTPPDEWDREDMEQRLRVLQQQLDVYRRRSGELRLALETLTTIDAVTGVRNRLGILQSIEGALQWNEREGQPFGVMSIRVPGLSRVVADEDEQVAEEALAHVAAVLSAGIRAVDRVGRWSDDTFFIVLHKLEEEGAARVSARLSSMLSAVPFQGGRGHYPLDPVTAVLLTVDPLRLRAEELADALEGLEGSADPEHPTLLHLRGPR